MNRWMLLGLISTLCGCATTGKSPAERRSEVHQYQQKRAEFEATFDPATYRSREGFENTTWGMTSAEVLSLTGASKDSTGPGLVRKASVAGREAVIHYQFANDRLAGVKIRVSPGTDRDTDFGNLKGALNQRYGSTAPTFGAGEQVLATVLLSLSLTAQIIHDIGETPAQKLNRIEASEARTRELLLPKTEVEYWTLPESRISLKGQGTSSSFELWLNYRSLELDRILTAVESEEQQRAIQAL